MHCYTEYGNELNQHTKAKLSTLLNMDEQAPPLSFPKLTIHFSNSKQDVCCNFRMVMDGHPEMVRIK